MCPLNHPNTRISQIIFACGSIIETNSLAMEQAKKIFNLLSSKQKKMCKLLISSKSATSKPSHPLNVNVRKEWILGDIDGLFQVD